MEEAVFNSIDDLWKNIDMCKCEKCKMDIASFSLNNLPPRYVVSSKGEVYSKTEVLEVQRIVDLIAVVTKSIEKIRKNPSHGA